MKSIVVKNKIINCKIHYVLFAAVLFCPICLSEDLNDLHKNINNPALKRLPLHFIENKGQLNKLICYYVNGNDKEYYFTQKAVIAIQSNIINGEIIKYTAMLEFSDARKNAVLYGLKKNNTVINYFKGNSSDWITNIKSYNELIYKDLWPGIDLIVYSEDFNIKYKLVVKAGAETNQIRLDYINENREYIARSSFKDIIKEKLCAYQEIEGRNIEVPINYKIIKENRESNKLISRINIKFNDNYIDKTVSINLPALLYCGYIGGKGDEWVGDMASDDYGNIYLTGQTSSDEASFPVKRGPDLSFNGGNTDVYIAKVNAAGTHLEYCGYIGGNKSESGLGIDVDSLGNAYIIGCTASKETDGFPLIIGPDLTYNGGTYDGFVAKINSDGTKLEYCGYIGGDEEECYLDADIAVDDLGYAYVTGKTHSDEGSFPVRVGPYLEYNGSYDAFVAKVHSSGNKLDYCGYIGGDKADVGEAIAVDKNGNAYIAGWTFSDGRPFPATVGPDLTYNGYGDGFVAKVDRRGTELKYCGYIGGVKADACSGVAVDSLRRLYVIGSTESSESSFPVCIGPELKYDGQQDAFVARVNNVGGKLEYCGYIGGDGFDIGIGIAVDGDCNSYAVGMTKSDESSFPVRGGPFLEYKNGLDTYVAKVESDGEDLGFCGYIGGYDSEYSRAIALDPLNNVCIMGTTESDENGFPVQIGPDLTFNSNGTTWGDAFVAKVIQKGLFCDTYTLSIDGGMIQYNLIAGLENAERPYIILGALNSTNPGSKIPGGYVKLPFVFDEFTKYLLLMIHSPSLRKFIGSLDENGNGMAYLITDPIDPEFLSITMYFSYCLFNPFDFVSNPVPVKIVE